MRVVGLLSFDLKMERQLAPAPHILSPTLQTTLLTCLGQEGVACYRGPGPQPLPQDLPTLRSGVAESQDSAGIKDLEALAPALDRRETEKQAGQGALPVTAGSAGSKPTESGTPACSRAGSLASFSTTQSCSSYQKPREGERRPPPGRASPQPCPVPGGRGLWTGRQPGPRMALEAGAQPITTMLSRPQGWQVP